MSEQNKKNGEEAEQKPLALNEGNKNTLMAILSYLSILVIIPLVAVKEDSFVKFHIKQGLVLVVIEAIVFILSKFVSISLLEILGIINIALLILSIMGIVNVARGKEKELPLVGSFAKYFKF